MPNGYSATFAEFVKTPDAGNSVPARPSKHFNQPHERIFTPVRHNLGDYYMSKIDEFKAAKREHSQANLWAEKIGKKYFGGTSGRGELGSIVSGKASLTVYYQHSDGDKNYHESPDGFNAALVEVIKRNQASLIEEAIEMLAVKSQQAALAATKEYAELMEAAGISKAQCGTV